MKTLLIVLLGASLGASALVACSSAKPSSAEKGQDEGDAVVGSDDTGSTAEGQTLATPPVTVTCDEVCVAVTQCGMDAPTCDSVCPDLAIPCKGCLSMSTTCGSECKDLCGVVNDPKKSKKDPTPVAGKKCDALTYSVDPFEKVHGKHTDGQPCTVPGDCASQICISGTIGSAPNTQQVSFCASFQECDKPDNSGDAYACPAGWKCVPVTQWASESTYMSCVPPEAKPCKPGELQYR